MRWEPGSTEDAPVFVWPKIRRKQLRTGVMQIKSTEFVTSVGRLDQIPSSGLPEIAFAGRSNVGKSSLLNRLLNRKNLAKTSNTPGKTRTLNYYVVNSKLHLVDLPGYGYAKRRQSEREQWAKLVNGYLQDREPMFGILQLLDARHDPTAQDLEMVSWLLQYGKPFVLVATKTDKLSSTKLKKRLNLTRKLLSELGEVSIIPFSAKTGTGREGIWRWIEEVLNG
jgi:GTP-binding protein